MSKAMNSPTARMLRSSRLFSMPPPLPPPAMELVLHSGRIKTSDTATHPYPTKQAITAPASSRHRGDWGLKRPLPQKTNNTSSPHVRINAIDTLEHITDFDSAANHTLSYKKWQEMNLHMTRQPVTTDRGSGLYPTEAPASAFSSSLDHTVLQDDRRRGQSTKTPINSLPLGLERALRIRAMKTNDIDDDHPSRWKFEGPHLPSMPQAEFDRYVRRVVESPEMRKQFREFLLVVLMREKRTRELENVRKESGFDPSSKEDMQRLANASKINEPEKEVEKFMLELRDKNDDLSAELSRLIGEFFDLPPFPKNKALPSGINLTAPLSEENSNPPPVHPSGGLSYIKTGAFMENHPVHGPQVSRTPVEARVLRPREDGNGQYEHALLGVGGFTARDITAKNFRTSKDTTISPGVRTHKWDFDDPDFNKLWVQPAYGFMDEAGKVRMRILYPDKEAVAVKTGEPDPRPRLVTEDDPEYIRKLKLFQISTARQRDSGATTTSDSGSGSAEPDVRRIGSIKGLDSKEIKQFQDIIRRPNQDLGRTLVETLRARAQMK